MGEGCGACVFFHEGRLDDAPFLIVNFGGNIDDGATICVFFTLINPPSEETDGAGNSQGMHDDICISLPHPIAGFVMKSFFVGFAHDDLVIMNCRKILCFTIRDLTDLAENNGFKIGISLLAIWVRRDVGALVAAPRTDEPGKGAKIYISVVAHFQTPAALNFHIVVGFSKGPMHVRRRGALQSRRATA
jgi:hypothetical protein